MAEETQTARPLQYNRVVQKNHIWTIFVGSPQGFNLGPYCLQKQTLMEWDKFIITA